MLPTHPKPHPRLTANITPLLHNSAVLLMFYSIYLTTSNMFGENSMLYFIVTLKSATKKNEYIPSDYLKGSVLF
jgi:hypothetical protein